MYIMAISQSPNRSSSKHKKIRTITAAAILLAIIFIIVLTIILINTRRN
ncbi:hypothetical protein [Mycoplasma amphoriforme]